MSFCVKNCRFRVDFYFFALLCAAAFFDRSGFMLRSLLASLLHECGHIAVMLSLPEHMPDEIRLTPFGVRIKSSPLSEFGRGNLLILAAGSMVNLISAAVTFGFFPEFAAVSLLLGVLNLLPVEGMDGGGILLSVLEKRLSGSRATNLTKIISTATLCGMALFGIYILFVTGYNFTLLGMTAALAAKAVKQWNQ